MKKTISLILTALLMLSCLTALSSCGTQSGMVLSIGSKPDTIDPALNTAVDGGTYVIHAFTGLVSRGLDKDGKTILTAGCAEEIPTGVKGKDGKVTYTFKLRDDLKWSDGTPLTAQDFVYAWNRAADPLTGADYGYMFEVIDGYDEVLTMYDKNGKLKDDKKQLNVTASDDGKELSVVLKVDVPYFAELCAFPTYMPVKQDVVEANGDAWATNPKTYIGNGPYKVTEFSQSKIVMEKNEHYFEADKIVSDKLVFAFNADDSSLLANYKNGSYLFIDSVPNNEIEAIKKEYKNEFFVEKQLGTYYISFNINDARLEGFTYEEKAKIFKALGLFIDRNYVVEEIGQAEQVPASSFVPQGLLEPDGTEFVKKNGPNNDGAGYFSVENSKEAYKDNFNQGIKLLEEVANSSKKFTVKDGVVSNFPEIEYITNDGTAHEALATYLQGVWQSVGIKTKLLTQEWNTFLNTRKEGDYSVARNGWLGDYNDPISFIDMWITASGNNDAQLGKGDHANYKGYSYNGKKNLTWSESYDKIVEKIKVETNFEKRFKLMHQAEDMFMQTGAICPIYYYTDIYMCSEKIDGFFSSDLGFKYFMYASLK